MKKTIKIIGILITIIFSIYMYNTFSTAATCEHTNKGILISKPATCSERGKQIDICRDCGILLTEEYSVPKDKNNHPNATSVVTTPATCISKGVRTYTCPDCKDENGNNTTWTKNIAKNPDNHTGTQTVKVAATCCKGTKYCESCKEEYDVTDPNNHEKAIIEKIKKEATCISNAKWRQYYPCCEKWVGEEYEKETGKSWEELMERVVTEENGKKVMIENKPKTYTVNGKTYEYGFDYDNHTGEQEKISVRYGYETKTKSNGKVVLVKYKYTTYKCSSCGMEYCVDKKVKTLTESETEEEGQGNNNAAFNIKEIKTQISKYNGGWDETAHYDWAHTDSNTNKLEFLPALYGDHNYNPKGNTVTDTLSLILCKQKHGSIRFRPSNEPNNEIIQVSEAFHPHHNTAALGDIKFSAQERVKSILSGEDYYKASTEVATQLFQYYVGTSYPWPAKVNDWEGDNLYYGGVYCHTPTWNPSGEAKTKTNNKQAYILSSGAKFAPTGEYFKFNKGNYQGTYSDIADEQLIQDALWKDEDGFNEGGKDSYSVANANADKLLEEAKAYVTYNRNVIENGGYDAHVSKDNSNAQVIVKRNDSNPDKSKYIVGPFIVEYPEDRRFSYIEDMYLIPKNKDGKQPEMRDFKIITSKGTEYPDPGDPFWVEFNAKEAGYPTSVELKMTFAYLEGCEGTYQVYKGEGKIYQVMGALYIQEIADAEHPAIPIYDRRYMGDKNNNEIQDDDEFADIIVDYHYWFKYMVRIYTRDTELKYPAQKLAELTNRKRTWKKHTISVTGGQMDLTMDFGGTVWEDTKGGKETSNDSVYNTSSEINGQKDRPMPNVIVTLYNKDGTIAKLTKDSDKNNNDQEQVQNPTKTDANGKYKFTGINSMYQYYVEFTYNSQYYEPVQYISPNDSTNGWGKGNWQLNSNGTDVVKERETINARFASIGSSPDNYVGGKGANKTYSKNDLLGKTLQNDGTYKAVVGNYIIIDEFGNLFFNHNNGETEIVKKITKVDANGNVTSTQDVKVSTLNSEIKRKVQYVKDCQLNSYTGMDTIKNNAYVRSNQLYPIYSSFYIYDENDMNLIQAKGKLTLINNNYIKSNIGFLYYNNANMYINQGYTLRRLADVALRKDIQNVHVTINNKEHTYIYDTRNGIDESGVITAQETPNDKTAWDISVRLADAYYNTAYSREIHPSDYEYKVEDYNGNADKYGKTQDSELNVYITYKITLKNQSLSVRTRIDEIVDYYDEDIISIIDSTADKYMLDNSYMEIKYGDDKGKYGINASNTSRYNQGTMLPDMDGYNNLYVQFDKDVYLKTGQTAYLYLTFRVKKDNNRNILLDEANWKLDANGNIVSTPIGVGKENLAEINGYSTIYADHTTVPNVYEIDTATGKIKTDKNGNAVLKNLGGMPAGIVDKDSNPGNLDPLDIRDSKYENFEDDTDKAPNIRLILSRLQDENRLIDGIAWEDIRTVTNDEQKTTVANGIVDNGETGINGITVQLVELMDNGTEYVWSNKKIIRNNDGTLNTQESKYDLEDVYTQKNGIFTPIINMKSANGGYLITDVTSDQDGYYAFKSYPAGNYVVRFIYGDTIKTVLPNQVNSNEVTDLLKEYGLNNKSYTGQDYKTTSYQVGIPEGKSFTFRNEKINSNNTAKFNSNESGKFAYDITASDITTNVSDVKDIMKDGNSNVDYSRPSATLNSREDVENYSKSNVTNHIAEVLASQEQLQEYYKNNKEVVNNLLAELMNKTAMTAETGVINIEVEKDTPRTEGQTKNNVLPYKIQNVNLGLEERPRAALAINAEVTNVKLTLADGSTLFDAKQTASNVLWKDHSQYDLGYNDNKILNKSYLLDDDKFGNIENIRIKNTTDARLGLIQLSMDEELMHGATIKISYKITVTNVGEVDYDDDQFYYTGITSNKNNVVKTTANQVIDYVANNQQFDAKLDENTAWKVIKVENIIEHNDINEDLVNTKLKDEIQKYNTIIITDENKSNISKAKLTPVVYSKENSQASDTLVLTQLITSENETDDLTYRNIVEIVKTSNDVGRRNQYSVVGNQNPTKEPQEIDSDTPEKVRILPPFGNAGIYIIVATTIMISAAILVGGIIFVKKKIIK